MKPFNLEEAINHQAFYLKNGYRGVIKYCVDDNVTASGSTPPYPYIGYILDNKGFIHKTQAAWNKHGESSMTFNFNATTMVEPTAQKQKEEPLKPMKPLKPFNLEEALAGRPVLLRVGKRARVLVDLSKEFGIKHNDSVLVGVTLADDDCAAAALIWKKDGSYGATDWLDIVGMYEEPPKSQEEILEEAWEKKGKVVKTDAWMTTVIEVVAKTANGEYIVRNPANGSLDEIGTYGKLNWQPYEEPKAPVLNHNLAILHLPKPITPKEGEDYWRIGKAAIGKLHVERARFSHLSHANRTHSEQGNCFASELDAQAWVNALDYARTGKVKIC